MIGVNLCESVDEIARTKTQNVPVTFLRAGAENLPAASSRFDKCFISFGLHHMPKQVRQNTLREVPRTLRSGGLFVVAYNLPARALVRLAIKSFVKLDEDEAAYKMLLGGSLPAEIQQAGLAIRRQEVTCSGTIQLVEALNP